MYSPYDFMDVFNGYVECVEWVNNGLVMESEENLAEAHAEVRDFFYSIMESPNTFAGVDESWSPTELGRDFYLTRNGHGAGFWDRGAGDLGDALSDWAKTFGETCYEVELLASNEEMSR